MTSAEREEQRAERALSAFREARRLSIEARQQKNVPLATGLDRLAMSFLASGEPVRVRYAQRRLGLSNPTIRSWIARGILERTGASPQRVSLLSLACVEETLEDLRRDGARRDLSAEMERRMQWESWRRSSVFEKELQRIRSKGPRKPPQGHRTAELRSLALHRRIAERLDPEMVARAQRRVARWLRRDGAVPAEGARQWQELLSLPLSKLGRLLVQDSERMRDLRQNTPFAGELPEPERMRLASQVHSRQ